MRFTRSHLRWHPAILPVPTSIRLAGVSTAQDGIVAKLMNSATQLNNSAPVHLLVPENTDSSSDKSFNSELFACASSSSQFKLIETGNISAFSGKYTMAYPTGPFETPCYKVGIAWADTLLGPYKKILQQDTGNVPCNPAAQAEVVYLLQSSQPGWPNYVNAMVQAPGVPSLVQYPAGTWYLYFAGYDPSVTASGGMFNPAVRQPYAMRLTFAIPLNTTVSATANTSLATWITAATN